MPDDFALGQVNEAWFHRLTNAAIEALAKMELADEAESLAEAKGLLAP